MENPVPLGSTRYLLSIYCITIFSVNSSGLYTKQKAGYRQQTADNRHKQTTESIPELPSDRHFLDMSEYICLK